MDRVYSLYLSLKMSESNIKTSDIQKKIISSLDNDSLQVLFFEKEFKKYLFNVFSNELDDEFFNIQCFYQDGRLVLNIAYLQDYSNVVENFDSLVLNSLLKKLMVDNSYYLFSEININDVHYDIEG